MGVEIDLILTRAKKPVFAIEIKSTTAIKNDDAYALREFKTEYPEVEAYIISPIERPRLLEDGIEVLSWKMYFEEKLKVRQ